MTALVWVGVVLLGGCGAVLRLVVTAGIDARTGRDLPIGTFVVNVSGALVLGLLAGLALSEDAALLAGTATVGSYTTFSTWLLDTQRLTEKHRPRAAGLNIVASLVLGVAAAALGRWLGRTL